MLGFGGNHIEYRIRSAWDATERKGCMGRIKLPVPIGQNAEDCDKIQSPTRDLKATDETELLVME